MSSPYLTTVLNPDGIEVPVMAPECCACGRDIPDGEAVTLEDWVYCRHHGEAQALAILQDPESYAGTKQDAAFVLRALMARAGVSCSRCGDK